MFSKRVMLVMGLSIPLAIGAFYSGERYGEMQPYLAADIKSEQTRMPSEGNPTGGEITVSENAKTFRDFLLYCKNSFNEKKPRYDIFVDKTTNRMEVYLGNSFVKSMRVSTGKVLKPNKSAFGEYVTPNGEYIFINFKDQSMLEQDFGRHSDYYGNGMFQLSGPWAPHIAIHGTNNANSLGSYESNGCIRVANDDVGWLRENIGIGSRVHVYQSHGQQ